MSWEWVGGSVKFLKQKLRWVGMAKKDLFSEASWIICDEPCEQIFSIFLSAPDFANIGTFIISIRQNQSPSDIFKAPSLRANFIVFLSAPPGCCQHSWNTYSKSAQNKFKPTSQESNLPKNSSSIWQVSSPIVKAPSNKFKAPSVKFKFYPTCSKLHLSSSKLHPTSPKLHPFNATRVSAV